MSIVNALFVPKGTIDKSGFFVAAGLLVALGVASDALQLAVPATGPILFFVGLLLAYCWVALWIKRFQGAGASGWWTILVVLVWVIIEAVVGFMVIAASGLDMSVFAGGDPEAIQRAMEPVVEAAAVPSLIASAAVSIVVAFGLNVILPHGRGGDRSGGGEAQEAEA